MRRLMSRGVMALAMFICFCAVSAENATHYGDWVNDTQLKTINIARTTNRAGGVTGAICSQDGNCFAYVIMNIECEENAKYPMLVNGANGIVPISTTCEVVGGSKIYSIDETEFILQAFESGGDIGYVMGLNGGLFKSMRFSTKGAVPALRAARLFSSLPQ